MLKDQMNNNEKLKGLGLQISEMNNNFEEMKRNREEAKKQLEARFIDIYRKITNMKEMIEMEEKRVNNSIKTFQSKFEYELNELRKKVYTEFNTEKEYVRKKFEENEKRMLIIP
jgi:Mg2+ and Co2+ transporter CorA